MSFSTARVGNYIRNFEFRKLFREELGWDNFRSSLHVPLDGSNYDFAGVAEKKGFQVFECVIPADREFPDRPTRLRLERQVTKSAYEHLIVFTDEGRTQQTWQWCRREPGRPERYPERNFTKGQSGEPLVQMLQPLAIELDEEESLALTDVRGRVRQAFDVEKVTKKFYELFRKEHEKFLGFIEGITSVADRTWYASLMLNRLMFIYFIQQKGFLAGDVDYLRNKLDEVRLKKGKGKFHSFYRLFLVRLFHEGLGQQPSQRVKDLQNLLGDVPYLNGGLFDVHELESANADIHIPDAAFARLFDFFKDYRWHLDERPLRNDKEINPDVLGYIFEKYINQKQMGAYYTKEDITGYIARNTVLPFVLDKARERCAIAFDPTGAVWKLLRDDPDRYIYEPVRWGIEPTPPAEIAAGLTDVSQRGGWNRSIGDDAKTLPTETWREFAARWQRCTDLRRKLRAGDVAQVNDLITLNLDIRQFAEDLIESSEGPELLRAVYEAVTTVSVLDPTCGSGAFLFAALNVLEPLYDACLDRMQAFLDDAARLDDAAKYADFRDILAEVGRHPNRRYFVLKAIAVNNLYGVDIMEEAVEICKLRLFLKLVAQVDKANQLEPLPDIDFNVRAGNTLVGFATLDDAKKGADLTTLAELEEIKQAATDLDMKFRVFRQQQTALIGGRLVVPWDKADLRTRLRDLRDRLDRYLAGVYGVDADAAAEFQGWHDSHKPFHWFAEFYGIMSAGGFDIIIGNPPYVEYSKIRKEYTIAGYLTLTSGNIYGPCIERSYHVLKVSGRFGFIVQAPLVSTQRMASVRQLLSSQSSRLWCSTYDDRPSKLFDGMHHCRLCIALSEKGVRLTGVPTATTRYYKWYATERENLFGTIGYHDVQIRDGQVIPKFRCQTEASVFGKLMAQTRTIGSLISDVETDYRIYYKITGVGHWFTFTLQPPKFWRGGVEGRSTRESSVAFPNDAVRNAAYCCLCSTLHYWVYQARTNCRDFNPSDLRFLPVPLAVASGLPVFNELAEQVRQRLEDTTELGSGSYAIGGAVEYQKFKPRSAKPIIDEIDRVLAKHFGFTPEELDFIINYDIKYRLGTDDAAEDDAE